MLMDIKSWILLNKKMDITKGIDKIDKWGWIQIVDCIMECLNSYSY